MQILCVPEHEVNERIEGKINEEQSVNVKALLRNHQDSFSVNANDIGRTHLLEHNIDTGSAKPIKQAPYRVLFAKRQAAEKEINSMLESDII